MTENPAHQRREIFVEGARETQRMQQTYARARGTNE
jgi:hypothetical protein